MARLIEPRSAGRPMAVVSDSTVNQSRLPSGAAAWSENARMLSFQPLAADDRIDQHGPRLEARRQGPARSRCSGGEAPRRAGTPRIYGKFWPAQILLGVQPPRPIRSTNEPSRSVTVPD